MTGASSRIGLSRSRLKSMPAVYLTSGLQEQDYATETNRLRDEDVARAAHRLDEARLLRVGLDLAPQAGDADVDRAVERLPLAVAGQREELVARQHPVGVLGEDAQQVELHAGERDLLALAADQVVGVEVELA